VGGGQGRTPILAPTIRNFLPKRHLLSYLEAIMRVYNRLGRRDNAFKARIKILVQSVGAEAFAEMVEAEWARIRDSALELPAEEVQRIAAYFAPPAYEDLPAEDPDLPFQRLREPAFGRWVEANVAAHKQPGYAIATISLKPIDETPGDASAAQMDAVADLAERYGFGEIRVSHEQNLILPDVRQADLYALWRELQPLGLATANAGLVTDIIACPGLDYCNLANARSIPVAQDIARRFADPERQRRIGELKIKISGCINACGHHHVGHIGILGVDKKGQEFYQITLGGSADETPALGDIVGRGLASDDVPGAVERIVDTYLETRRDGEQFLDTYRRIGAEPFKETLYAAH
jgi:sulfite reductase (NADPH) hemoprotein beta-component